MLRCVYIIIIYILLYRCMCTCAWEECLCVHVYVFIRMSNFTQTSRSTRARSMKTWRERGLNEARTGLEQRKKGSTHSNACWNGCMLSVGNFEDLLLLFEDLEDLNKLRL